MTKDTFISRYFKSCMEIHYKTDRMPEPVSMMLLAIDFENQVMKLCPIDIELYEEKEIWVSIDYCEFPPKFRGLNLVKDGK